MTLRVISILLIFIISCKTDSSKWQTLDLGAFKMTVPYDWQKFEVQGIDSYVGGLTNGKDSIWFDYGWYSAEIDDEDSSSHLYGQDTINGLIAIIQIPKVDGQGYINLSIPHINKEDKFSLRGHNIKGTDTILKMYRSLVFKESDTSKNSHMRPDKFKEYRFGSDQTLFNSYCGSCHSVTRYLVGPPLMVVLQQRNKEWMYTFLKDRKAILTDSLRKETLSKSNGMRCPTFPDLTKNDIAQIINYVTR